MKQNIRTNCHTRHSLAVSLALLTLAAHSSWGTDRGLSDQFTKELTPDHYYQLDIGDLDKLPRPENTRKRQHWWSSEYAPIEKWETTGVKFAGYLHGAEWAQEFWTKPESNSLLVFFGDYPHASEKRKILRCYIPDTAKHPTWTERALNAASKNNSQVVIYGRLVWDNYLTKEWVLILNRIQVKQNNVMVDL